MIAFEKLLERLGDNVVSRNGDRAEARCPCHDDRSPSLSIGLRADGRGVVLTCHAGCPSADVLAAVGWEMPMLYDDHWEHRGGRVEVAVYPYTDEHGAPLFEVVRFHPKEFRQRRPSGEWGISGVRRVLYRLPRLITAVRAGATVYVAEGEKDVHALERAGVVATCNPMGAGKWRGEYSESLRGASVVIVADADEAGREHARAVARSLRGAATSVQVVAPAVGKDAHDHLAAGRSISDFAALDPEDIGMLPSPDHADTDAGFGALGKIPDYPIDALPAPARELVRRGAGNGLPAALVGGASTAALAAAIGSEATIEVVAGWQERATLWVALIAPRGAGKSPSQGLAFNPIRLWDVDATGKDEDASRVLLGDTTVEALARDLDEAEGSATLDLDELAVMLRGMGEYKGGPSGDRGRFLSLWTGDPWSYRRVGSGGKSKNAIRLHIDRPTLSICGGLQPSLHELLGGEEDGMRPRWLPHLAAMPEHDGRLGDAEVPEAWRRLLKRLLSARRRTRLWKITGEARRVFEAYRRAWKARARGHESATLSAALVKADIHLARVILILAEADHCGVGGDVAVDVVHRAARIVEYTLDCWRALPEQGSLALSRRDEQLDRAVTRLVAWLEEHGRRASKREIQRARVAGVRTAEELNALLARYEAIYPGTVTETRPEQGGRPIVVVTAPSRHAYTAMSPLGAIEVSGAENPHEHWESGAVATGDIAPGDIAFGDIAFGDIGMF